jgi:hypothetical protein
MHPKVIITIYEEASFRSQENTTDTHKKIGFKMDTFLKKFFKCITQSKIKQNVCWLLYYNFAKNCLKLKKNTNYAKNGLRKNISCKFRLILHVDKKVSYRTMMAPILFLTFSSCEVVAPRGSSSLAVATVPSTSPCPLLASSSSSLLLIAS